MENEKTNWGWIILIFLFFLVFSGGSGLFGNRANALEYGMCREVSNCEVEKQTIINTATTQNLINNQAEATRAQASRIYEAQQAEKLFDLKLDAQTTAILNGQTLIAKDSEIALLKKTIVDNEKYCALNAKIDALSCALPKRPPYFARGYVPDGTCIPPICGE